MRILMRNTVFKTAALAGLFLCMLMLAGAFSGITASVHAMHGFIHADQVGTDETKLKEFVEDAVDAYYIDFLIKGEEEHCDLTGLDLPPVARGALPAFLIPYGISDLTPSSMRMLTTDQIKGLIALFNNPTVQSLLPPDFDFWGACDLPPASSYREVFGSEEGEWRSDPIYLFVAQYMDQSPQQSLIYHGIDMDFENQDVVGLEDESGEMVMDLIEDAADGTVQGRTEAGFLDYCWDDPTTEDDNIDDMDILTAPGDSWKTSYVVDPFDYLGVSAPSGSPRVIFGSGIYPETGTRTPPSGCDGNGMADSGDRMEPMDPEPMDPEPMDPEPMDPEPMDPEMVTSVSGGGCAIVAGSDGTTTSNAFNLLLIVSALLFTVSFGNRAMGRRNRISS